ncbi:MAG TPA: hypothetical protein VMF32_23065 [Xanthobacteraceae bacterium]|nr:hypothetical protein [Xanthobacteraceae bacterium]
MTNDEFRDLCEHVLIPRLGEYLRRELSDVREILENLSDSYLRIADRVDEIAIDLDRCNDAEDR